MLYSFYPLIHPNTHLLSIYYVPGTLLGTAVSGDTKPCTRGAYDCAGTGRKRAETHTGKTSSGELNGAGGRGVPSLLASRLAPGCGGVVPEGTGRRLQVPLPCCLGASSEAWGGPPRSQRHSQWQTGVACSRLCVSLGGKSEVCLHSPSETSLPSSPTNVGFSPFLSHACRLGLPPTHGSPHVGLRLCFQGNPH